MFDAIGLGEDANLVGSARKWSFRALSGKDFRVLVDVVLAGILATWQDKGGGLKFT
jgi:hypothetical protein